MKKNKKTELTIPAFKEGEQFIEDCIDLPGNVVQYNILITHKHNKDIAISATVFETPEEEVVVENITLLDLGETGEDPSKNEAFITENKEAIIALFTEAFEIEVYDL